MSKQRLQGIIKKHYLQQGHGFIQFCELTKKDREFHKLEKEDIKKDIYFYFCELPEKWAFTNGCKVTFDLEKHRFGLRAKNIDFVGRKAGKDNV